MEKGKIVIITGNKYPEGDAGSIRQHSFAKIFNKLGYNPIVIGMGESTGFQAKSFDGITYYSLRYSNKNLISRYLGRKLFYFNVKRTINRIGTQDISSILIVTGNRRVIKYAKAISDKYRIQLYHDSVEWYSASEFINGEKNREYRNNNTLNTVLIDKHFKVFSISRYLDSYFRSKGIESLRIPVIMDVAKVPHNKRRTNDKITFLYAGAMGGKDRIDIFIQALSKLEEPLQNRCEMFIVGATYEEYKRLYGDIDENILNTVVFFKGRVKREKVFDYLSRADFTVLIRPDNERYAMAGFPTKVVESLASATPVVCNLTSDLDIYLENNKTAIFVEAFNVDSCVHSICQILQMDSSKLSYMKENALRAAERLFDWEMYAECVLQFMNKKE